MVDEYAGPLGGNKPAKKAANVAKKAEAAADKEAAAIQLEDNVAGFEI